MVESTTKENKKWNSDHTWVCMYGEVSDKNDEVGGLDY